MIFSFFKKKPEEFVLAFLLKEQEGIITLLSGPQGARTLQGKVHFNFTDGWEHISEDADEALLRLPKESVQMAHSALFFLYSQSIDEHGLVQSSYLKKIKRFAHELELSPLGFIECQEGAVSWIHRSEGVMFSGVIVELDITAVSVFVFKAGRREFMKTAPRTDKVVMDIESMLETGVEKILPSRILVYNSSSAGKVAEEIVSHHWKPNLFTQLPKVSVVLEDQLLQGLMFLVNEHSSDSESTKKTAEIKEKPIINESPKLGFQFEGEGVEEVKIESDLQEKKINVCQKKSFSLPQVSFHFPKFNLLNFIKNKSLFVRIVFFTVILMLFIGMAVLGETTFHKAKLTLQFSPVSVTKDLEFMLSGESEDNFEYIVSTLSARVKQQTKTTGKKQTGEKAKGEVTIYNFDDKERSLNKGTSISSGSISFFLDDSVKIASASLTVLSDGSVAKLPGKTKTKVTASQFGSSGNLAKNQKFTVSDLSQSNCFALNELAFSGGTQRDIKVVAQSDLDTLRAGAISQGKKELKQPIVEKESSGERIISDLIEYSIDSPTYSNALNDEADELELEGTVKAIVYSVNEEEVKNRMNKIYIKDLPQEYTFSKLTKLTFGSKNKKGNIPVSITAQAIRRVDVSTVISRLKGAQKSTVEQYLKELGVRDWTLYISPPVYIIRDWMPFLRNNIQIEIRTQ